MVDGYSSSSPVEDITSISGSVENLNENVTGDVQNHNIGNGAAESVVNVGQISLDRHVTQQNYSVGQTQQADLNDTESFVYVILVIDSESQELKRKFKVNTSDLNTTLDQVREKLKSQGLRVEDRFVKEVNGTFYRISNETDFTLNDIKNGNAVYVDFDADSIKQYLKGLRKDADGQLTMTNHTVADFKRYPHIRTTNYSGFESGYTFDPSGMDMLKSGLTDESANYAKILSYSSTKQDTYWSGQGTDHFPRISYNIARYVVEKKDIEITGDDLSINSEFYDEIYRALSPGGSRLSKARELLALLQKYGWYVPLHYKTGGFFYVTNEETVNDSQKAVDNSLNLLHCFQLAATRKSNDAVESAPNCKQMINVQDVQNIDQSMRISSSPASFNRHSSLVDMYEDTLRDRKQWKIVEYERLLPILLLLQDYNNGMLSLCMQLLSEFRTDLQKEEADINIREYSLRMEILVYNTQ